MHTVIHKHRTGELYHNRVGRSGGEIRRNDEVEGLKERLVESAKV